MKSVFYFILFWKNWIVVFCSLHVNLNVITNEFVFEVKNDIELQLFY